MNAEGKEDRRGSRARGYRGRLAPSPTGFLHLGHARTFWTAQQRARSSGGTLVMRSEDLDKSRCRPEFRDAMFEDLRWFGFEWDEGPDIGGPSGPYEQSRRIEFYREAFRRLRDRGYLFPCRCSRRDIQSALAAPHLGEEEPVYPGTCRAREATPEDQSRAAWRFRVPSDEVIEFVDGGQGIQRWVAGRDFGDFVVWRNDDVPSYQLACVVDDAAMGITEVVRGADLLLSTARQILLYRALELTVPSFHHCPLVTDELGVRLAKRHDALSLRRLREMGRSPESLRSGWAKD
ncbi:MAG: tRNA glutamyl-Q(34) synthetase GluQRS [Verrucomicrobiales bacterium]|nr:tRNA glutamyl-Q(34) synthetase GluQRS [Verrucomicrobiales bacterium]